MNQKLGIAIKKSANSIYSSVPVLAGIILLIGLANTLIPKSIYVSLFGKNFILNSVIGGAIGSVVAGNPITSYILGGELVDQGISLVAVTSFIIAWVTVGLIQLPAEALLLGKKFAILRNIISFVFSIFAAMVTVFLVGLL